MGMSQKANIMYKNQGHGFMMLRMLAIDIILLIYMQQ